MEFKYYRHKRTKEAIRVEMPVRHEEFPVCYAIDTHNRYKIIPRSEMSQYYLITEDEFYKAKREP